MAWTFPELTETALISLGRRLAPALRPGDTLLLSGDLGAGKSTLARAIIAAVLPAPEDIPSPTFTLVQVYNGQNGDIWHCDLYRLTGPDHLDELGLTEAFETAICLVEWPDRLDGFAPADAAQFHLSGRGDTRRLEVTAPGVWDAKLQGLHP